MILHLQKFLLTLIFISFLTTLQGQVGKIKGKIMDEKSPLAYTTVVLKSWADSSIVKAEITNTNGDFIFRNIAFTDYFIEVSYVGMNPFVSEKISLAEPLLVFPTIELQISSNKLNTVEVVAQRPMIEVMADKTVFNVENTLNATGTNGFELLRKAPGVIIDNNNNLILDGKTGVLIFINGKPSPLSGEDLTNFLSTLQSSDIDKIEIITQPSSKYDAAGNAGIINIKLKKDKGLGTNGNVVVGLTHGKYLSSNTSLSFNTRTKKSNLFGSYSNSFGKNWSFLNLDRTQGNVRYNAESETIRNNEAHNFRAGLDIFQKENHTFGILLSGNLFQNTADGFTNTPIIPQNSSTADQILKARNESENDSYNFSGNINYRFADTSGHELLVDFDYGKYGRDRTNFQPNVYLEANGETQIFEANYRMITPTDIDILTAKIDYSQNLAGGQIGVGAKYSRVKTDNNFQFYNVVGGNDLFNEDRSNDFEYSENINAFYLNYNKSFTKWNFQSGIRLEQTISEGNLTSNQMSSEDNVQRNYWDWFPSAGLTYTPSRIRSWALTYSRRIQRPNYQSLNPFEYQVDELSFSKGNPFLQPQYTDNLKLSHTYKYTLTTSLGYSRIQDFFAQVTDTLGATRNFMITQNIANQEVWNIGVSYPFNVNKWWSVYTSINAYHSSYEGNDEKFVSVDQSTLSLYAQNTFTLPKGFRMEISGWFSSPSVWGGTYRTQSMGSLNVAFQKKFWKDNLSIRLSMSDILYTSFWQADVRFGDLYIDGSGGQDSRRVRLNASYRFGNKQVKKSRKRNTGLEDEDKRVGN